MCTHVCIVCMCLAACVVVEEVVGVCVGPSVSHDVYKTCVVTPW